MKRITPTTGEPTTTLGVIQEVPAGSFQPLPRAGGSLPGRPGSEHFGSRLS
jgi:hypothetical protein